MTTSQPGDFAADVLDILIRSGVTFRGCKPQHLEIFLDGSVKMWFAGHRDGKPWRGGITIRLSNIITGAIEAGDSETIARECENIIDHNSARFY